MPGREMGLLDNTNNKILCLCKKINMKKQYTAEWFLFINDKFETVYYCEKDVDDDRRLYAKRGSNYVFVSLNDLITLQLYPEEHEKILNSLIQDWRDEFSHEDLHERKKQNIKSLDEV